MFQRLAVCVLFGFHLVSAHSAESTSKPADLPNILLILADDMGFSDLGSYGGEIATPNLDRLATNGLRFTQFYNTARCWPTRAALLSGYYPQQIRMDPPRGRLPGWARLLPHHLNPLGYRSYHAGKWHIQGAPRTIADGGFDRSYRLDDHDRNFYPRNHSLDDVRLPPVPKGSNYYTTTAFADFTIQCLRNHATEFKGRPFFAYLAFTVPHFPLQAPARDIAPYRDTYRVGWDVIRRQRHERQRQMGILNTVLSESEPGIVPHWNLSEDELHEQISPHEVARAVRWEDLNQEQKEFQASKMAIHAAMITRMDREIGRVLNQLEAMGALDNTIILFASDNGASAEFLNRGDRHDATAEPGSAESYLCLGPGWSTAANTPFRLHKSWVHEGGIATPLIVHWPKGIAARDEFRRTPGHVIDIVPTLLELTGAKTESSAPALPSRSLVPTFARDVEIPRDFLYFHHERNRALRIGDWKLVSKRPATNNYALYNLKLDRTERTNLASTHPERLVEMSRRWQQIETVFRATAELTHENIPSLNQPRRLETRHAGEGPAWHAPSKTLYFTGDNKISRLLPNGSTEAFRDPSQGANGLLFDHQGRLVTCEAQSRRVTRTELDGRIIVLADNFQGSKFNSPNDLTIDSKGRIYFSDPRYGSRDSMEIRDADGKVVEGVYRIDSPGRVERVITHEVDRPNGLLVTPDDKYLFVADNNNNTQGGARKLWRFDLSADGSIEPQSRVMVFDWKTSRGPDGLKVDKQNRLFVAAGLNNPNSPYETAEPFKGGIYILSLAGKLLDFISIPTDEVTNCTFGGENLQTLYVTAGGSLWAVKLD